MEKVQAKNESMIKALQPGEVVPYADGLGRVYRLKIPAPEPDALPASLLPEVINVFSAPSVTLPIWRRYAPTMTVSECDVIAVSNLPNALYAPVGLLARLHGCRLVDCQWLRSKMKEGQCLAFSRALSMHLYFWLSEQFCQAFPTESALLLEEAAAASKSASGSASYKGLFIRRGPFPAKPKHPRLTFEVVPDEDVKSSHQVSLQGLLAKLSNVKRC